MTRQIKKVKKYHYHYEKICDETDVIYTRCYMCGELKPSGTKYFRKDKAPQRERDFRPLCKECANKGLREYLKNREYQREMEEMKEVSKDTIQVNQLFDEEETVESKLDKLLAYLWLK